MKDLSQKEEKFQRRSNRSNLVYDNYFDFFIYCDTKEFAKRPPGLKLNELNEFKDKLEINQLKIRKKS